MIIDNTALSRRDTGDDNMIPLINIVFLMLIFFMVAGQVSKSDVTTTLPPKSINDNRLNESESLNIVMTVDGSVYIDDQSVEPGNIKSVIENRLPEYSDLDTLSVHIKVDSELPVAELRALLKQVREAGLVKVSLITRLAEANDDLG